MSFATFCVHMYVCVHKNPQARKAAGLQGRGSAPVVAAPVESTHPSQRGLGVGAGFLVEWMSVGEMSWPAKDGVSKEGAASSDEVAITMGSPWGVQQWWGPQLSDEAEEKWSH